ncbi:hypothetical protein EG68_05274 [Paragonimus skrjabini miyazakii]|uniref:Uncharacterized protein n=1 Tax=Paragonimus skrjabini miyazakii TaxID=59628 RepID=A0A8S9YVM6_9TREM|nr:hypothetical protein EG68_05274 [Paragonimus skrjabini miyazakii]
MTCENQRILKQLFERLPDLPSFDATALDYVGKRKQLDEFTLCSACSQRIVHWEFTHETQEEGNRRFIPSTSIIPHHLSLLNNVSHLVLSSKRLTMGSLKCLSAFFSHIASRCDGTLYYSSEGVRKCVAIPTCSCWSINNSAFLVRFSVQTIEDMQLLIVKLEDVAVHKQLVCCIVLIHSTKATFPTIVGDPFMDECICNVLRTLTTDDEAKAVNYRGVNNHVPIASTPTTTDIVESVMEKACLGVSHAS